MAKDAKALSAALAALGNGKSVQAARLEAPPVATSELSAPRVPRNPSNPTSAKPPKPETMQLNVRVSLGFPKSLESAMAALMAEGHGRMTLGQTMETVLAEWHERRAKRAKSA